MKHKSLALIAVAIVISASLPITNFILGHFLPRKINTLEELKSAAFKTDFYTGLANILRVHLGYSSSPMQVIIGSNGWLYLGNQYASSVSVSSGLLMPSNSDFEADKSRRRYIQERAAHYGAINTYYFVAPNKEDVYPEYTPQWTRSQKPNFVTHLLQNSEAGLTYLLPSLIREKPSTLPLYYKTDSHWNDLGAWIAYKEISNVIGSNLNEVKFLSENDISHGTPLAINGGDLSAFLFTNTYQKDLSPSISISNDTKIRVYDTKAKKTTYFGANKTLYNVAYPLIVSSDNALNDKRVLWLRDSFGNNLSRYMAKTFKETIQIHLGGVLNSNKMLESLLKTYKPDIVITTIAGRSYFQQVYFSKRYAEAYDK